MENKIKRQNKPCLNCYYLDEFGYCECEEKSPICITEEETKNFSCFLDKTQGKEMQHTIEYYRKNPVRFVEDFLGVKLTDWQKIMLNTMNKGGKQYE